MEMVSLSSDFMKLKFSFIVVLLLTISCSERAVENKKEKAQIDYYQFREMHLDSLGIQAVIMITNETCLLYTSPSPRDKRQDRMPSSA